MQKKNIITIGVAVAITAALIGVVIFGIVKSRQDKPELPPETSTEEITTTPEIPSIEPNDNKGESQEERPGEVVIDIVKENEKHEKPNEPVVEGKPFMADDQKEVTDEEAN